MERVQFHRLQALLRLPDPVWELADRFRLEEKRLRYVLKVLDETQQVELVRAIIEQNLSAERVQQIVESGRLVDFLEGTDRYHGQGYKTAAERVADRWAGLAGQIPKADLGMVADRWLSRQTTDEVRQQIATLYELLEIVERRLDD